VPAGTKKAETSRLRVALKSSPAYSRPVAYLPRYAQKVLGEAERATTASGTPKSESSKSGIRTSSSNFGKWLVKNGRADLPDRVRAGLRRTADL